MNYPEPLQAGTRIDGCEIETALWTSHSGLIYRARDLNKARRVLIQEYLPPTLATRHRSGIHVMALAGLEAELEDGLARFLNEARILAQINDPYVCRVYAYTQCNATAYMVLDYEPGQTLNEHLSGNKTPLDETGIRKLLLPLLKGLRAAHDCELLHRDIHPGNIYLRDIGPPVLIGFGSPSAPPRAAGEPHSDNRVAPGYTPLEQYQSDGETGPWTDLYALGATMYRCLSGATPVDAARRVTHIDQGGADPLVPAMQLGGSDSSAALLSAIDWMLEPMPADRPEAAGAVLGPLSEDRSAAATEAGRRPAFSAPGHQRAPGTAGPDPAGPIQREPGRGRAPPAAAAASVAETIRRVAVTGVLQRPTREAAPRRRGAWQLPLLLAAAGLALGAAFLVHRPDSPPTAGLNQSMPDSGVPAPAPGGDYVPPDIPERVSFDRERDAERADAYRDMQRERKQIESSLAAARDHLAHGRLLAPAGNNALDNYRFVLDLDPDHSGARRGIRAIQDQLTEAAESAFENGAIDQARRVLERAAEIREASAGMAALRRRIDAHVAEQQRLAAEARAREQARRARIDALLEQAEAARQAGRLTAPPAGNALSHYRQLLRLDPGNERAARGIEQIGRRKLDQAADALAKDQLDRAGTLLASAASLLPENETVPLLQKQRDTRMEIVAARREAEAEQTRQAEAEARAEQARRAEAEARAEQTRQAEAEAQAQQTRQAEAEARAEQARRAGAEAAKAPDQDAAQAARAAAQARGVDAYYAGDYDTAFQLLNPLAAQGETRAKFRVAMMYLHGRGLDPDPALARTLVREALPGIQEEAERGTAWAQADLASLYADGIVVAENDEEAVRLYTRAAEQGYAGAQTNLGVMYANGEGVAPSRDQAVLWLRRAAAQGDRIAQNNLRVLGVQ